MTVTNLPVSMFDIRCEKCFLTAPPGMAVDEMNMSCFITVNTADFIFASVTWTEKSNFMSREVLIFFFTSVVFLYINS